MGKITPLPPVTLDNRLEHSIQRLVTLLANPLPLLLRDVIYGWSFASIILIISWCYFCAGYRGLYTGKKMCNSISVPTKRKGAKFLAYLGYRVFRIKATWAPSLSTRRMTWTSVRKTAVGTFIAFVYSCRKRLLTSPVYQRGGDIFHGGLFTLFR